MDVYAAVQSTHTGRVFVVMRDQANQYYWIRATPGQTMQGPFDDLDHLFADMDAIEGRSSIHFAKVFKTMYPDMPVTTLRA